MRLKAVSYPDLEMGDLENENVKRAAIWRNGEVEGHGNRNDEQVGR